MDVCPYRRQMISLRASLEYLTVNADASDRHDPGIAAPPRVPYPLFKSFDCPADPNPRQEY